MKCIHQPNRLSVIPSELAPLLDVIPVGVEVQTDEVLDQPRCAHALSSEEADNPVQFVTHLLADEHGLAVDNLGDLEIGGAVFLQRQPALLAADTLLRHCNFPDRLTCLRTHPPRRTEPSSEAVGEIAMPQKRVSCKQRRLSLEEYRATYLQVPKIVNRKPVFVSEEVRDELDRIVRFLGGKGMSASGLIENLVRLHLDTYRNDIEQWRKL